MGVSGEDPRLLFPPASLAHTRLNALADPPSPSPSAASCTRYHFLSWARKKEGKAMQGSTRVHKSHFRTELGSGQRDTHCPAGVVLPHLPVSFSGAHRPTGAGTDIGSTNCGRGGEDAANSPSCCFPHSARRACVGWIDAARLAGSRQAAIATASRNSVTKQ